MSVINIIGPHPPVPNPLSVHLDAIDKKTAHDVPHRILSFDSENSSEFTDALSQWIVMHHVAPDAIARDKERREALARLGFVDSTMRLPTNESTRKGNWAEILLAEYLIASGNTQLPVYRLRYNPNVDQSMKGDDVLAFDLNSNPVRIIVGEAKFRSVSAIKAVNDIVEALEKSKSGNVPASLQFVADRLFDSGMNALGAKIANCNSLFASGALQLDYVGLLVSNEKAHTHMSENAQSTLPRIALISLALKDPASFVEESFTKAALLI